MKTTRTDNQHSAGRAKLLFAYMGCALILTGCHWDMWDQARYEPLEAGAFFGEGESSSRMLVEGTVPYQMAKLDTHYYEGMVNGEIVKTLPASITLDRALLERGQDRFAIFCTPCHGATGDGNGMITKRGFPLPPSYHIDRLREADIGYFYDVMTNGFGRMYSYATRINPEDRWAIAAYIRALQLSQAGTAKNLPHDAFEKIKQSALNPPVETGGHGEAAAHGETTDHAATEEVSHETTPQNGHGETTNGEH